MIVTIDGPAGAGKSTVAKEVARRLGFIYLDTGAMYRALTWKALEHHLDVKDEVAMGQLAASTDVRLIPDPLAMRVLVDEIDVTDCIRTPEVSRNVSDVALVASVRDEMVRLQRQLAMNAGVVAEGRDMGTVVFPRAELKIYLVASPGERALRRAKDLEAAGHEVDLAGLEAEIARRDGIDSNREVAPLTQAPDAILLNTDGLTPTEVIAEILALAKAAEHQ